MTRDTLTGPAPMDVSAVYEGRGKGKGKNCKGKGKNKDKEKGSHGEPRCSDHRKGHRKRNCRTFEQDKEKGVDAVVQAPGLSPGSAAAPSVTPSRVSMIELDDWILAVSLDDHEGDGGQWGCGFSLSARICA